MVARFHQRFGYEVGAIEARRRFVNRVHNQILSQWWNWYEVADDKLLRVMAHDFGEPDSALGDIDELLRFVKRDFLRTLQVVEAIWRRCPHARVWLNENIRHLMAVSEANLGIVWNLGVFRRAGAPVLDEKLARDPLDWLREHDFQSIRKPYEKALRELLVGEKQPERLTDAITDAYEALEAMAKHVMRRDLDLAKGREQFISKLKTSSEYRKLLGILLKDYIDYGCRFRHGASDQKPKPAASMGEVESFVYMTGIFLRLCTLME